MRNVRVFAIGAALALTVSAFVVSGPASARVTEAAEPAPAAVAPSCPLGNVCFYGGADFTGKRCDWSVADPDWQAGSIRCSWSGAAAPKSVFNRGQSTDYTGVAYYKQPNYVGFLGCVRQGASFNLPPLAGIRSHRWISGNC